MTTPYRPDNPFAPKRYSAGNPFADPEDRASPLDAIEGLVAPRPAADRTDRPFHTGAEAREVHKAVQADNAKDLRAVLATMGQGATFGFADDVLPESFGASVDYLKQRAPAVASGAEMVGGLLVPGVGSLKAAKALRPTTRVGQVATGAGIGAANAALAGAGNTAGGVLERLQGAAEAVPAGAVIGGGIGAVPSAVAAVGNTIQLVKRAPGASLAAVRTAGRALTGRRPSLTDLAKLGSAGQAALRGKGKMFSGLGEDIPMSELASKASRRLNPNRMLEGVDDIPRGLSVSEGQPPKRLADVVRKAPEPAVKTMDGEAPPLTGLAKQVAEDTDDPIIKAMAAQVQSKAPLTPKPSTPRGPLAEAKSTRAGKGTREAMDAQARALGIDPDAIRAMSPEEYVAFKRSQFGAPDPRAEYGNYLKEHGRGSAQRRGQILEDTRLNQDAQARMRALQEQADAAPEGEAGDGIREALYKQWRQLKLEYGNVPPLVMGGAAAVAGGALAAALAAKRKRP